MPRAAILGVARVLSVGVAAVLLFAAPARADLITINFTGEVDLTSEGGDVYAYSGFITWNTAALPFESEPGLASYALADYSLIFDGADVTLAPSPDGQGNGLVVANDFDLVDIGEIDALGFYAAVGRPFDPTGDLVLVGVLAGPTTMFNSTALPSNLDFLSDVSLMFTQWLFEPDDAEEEEEIFFDREGTLSITGTSVVPVPEPGTLSLVALGLAGAVARARRARRIAKAG